MQHYESDDETDYLVFADRFIKPDPQDKMRLCCTSDPNVCGFAQIVGGRHLPISCRGMSLKKRFPAEAYNASCMVVYTHGRGFSPVRPVDHPLENPAPKISLLLRQLIGRLASSF